MINRKVWIGWGSMLLCFCMACGPVYDKVNLSTFLPGDWQNIQMEVALTTVNGSDSNSVFSADEATWEQVLRIQPILTNYNTDSSYVSEYLDLFGNRIKKFTGRWSVKGDSLIHKQLQPIPATHRFEVKVRHNKAFFKGTIDFDQDGEVDDVYQATQRKLDNS